MRELRSCLVKEPGVTIQRFAHTQMLFMEPPQLGMNRVQYGLIERLRLPNQPERLIFANDTNITTHSRESARPPLRAKPVVIVVTLSPPKQKNAPRKKRVPGN